MTGEPSAAAIAELAPGGVMTAGINLGNPVIAQRDPAGGEPRGIGPALARELARRIGAEVRFVTYETAGKLADAVREGAWDVAFLAIDPERAIDIDFTNAYVHIEGTYLVRSGSALRTVEDVDREGTRIAVGLKTAYDLFLSRKITKASLVRAGSSVEAIATFVAEGLDAVAGVRQPLVAYAAKHPGHRVMEDSFMVIRQAAGVPKGRPAAHRFVADFIEEAKAFGFAARALKESGVEATIAP
jgi:polar amino acid transport system substrate-binding protein